MAFSFGRDGQHAIGVFRVGYKSPWTSKLDKDFLGGWQLSTRPLPERGWVVGTAHMRRGKGLLKRRRPARSTCWSSGVGFASWSPILPLLFPGIRAVRRLQMPTSSRDAKCADRPTCSGMSTDGIGDSLARKRILIKVLHESLSPSRVHCPAARDDVRHARAQKSIGNAVESAGAAAARRGVAGREHRQLQTLQLKLPYVRLRP